jgi:hypothetical protein
VIGSGDMKRYLILCAFAPGFCFAFLAQSAQPPKTLTAAEVRTHFSVIGKLDPTRAHLYEQLTKRFGRKATYSADEVTAIVSPKVPGTPDDIVTLPIVERHLPVLPGAFSRDQVKAYFSILQATDPKSKASMEALDKKFGIQPWYLATELREIEKNGAVDAPPMVDRPPTPIVARAEAEAKALQVHSMFLDGFKRPLIRHDWTDVLLNEDESQPDNNSSKKVDDLVGATFSYSRNLSAGTDTWNSVGALIIPWVWDGIVEPGVVPDHIGLAPSVSLNRISTSGPPKDEVDQVFYRFGAFVEWYEFLPGLTDLQLRAAGVYGTDTSHRASMPGFEFDLEPRLLFSNSSGHECFYKIGYRNTLIPKAPLKEDGSDQSLLDYQLRLWLHVEGGDIQDVGKAFATVPGSFFRLGPTAQLRVNAPELWNGMSFSALYSYLPAQSGPTGRDSLLKLDWTLVLISDPTQHEKVSLNANYTRGGLNFTKQTVDTFTLGLSVLY